MYAMERVFGRSEQMTELRQLLGAISDKASLVDAKAAQLLDSRTTLRLKPVSGDIAEDDAGDSDPRLPDLLLEPLTDLATTITILQARFAKVLEGFTPDQEENPLVFESRLQIRRLGQVAELCQRFLRYQENREEIYWLESRKSFRGEPWIPGA